MTHIVLVSELFIAENKFDAANALRTTLNNIFVRGLFLILYADSKYICDSLSGIKFTTKKHIFIDLCILHSSYDLRELTGDIEIPRVQAHADTMT